jgi:hypothetical protein
MFEVLSRELSERDFFGNFLPALEYTARGTHFIWSRPQRPRRKIRRRGYRDHGSAVPSERWKPRHDWTLTELQNSIEHRRKSAQDHIDFLCGFLD